MTPTTPPPQRAEKVEREAFEAWARSKFYVVAVATVSPGLWCYVDETTSNAWAGWQAARAQPAALQEALFEAIAHGDDEHRSWLKQAISDHFAGRSVERPRGKGTTAAMQEEVERLRAALTEIVRDATVFPEGGKSMNADQRFKRIGNVARAALRMWKDD